MARTVNLLNDYNSLLKTSSSSGLPIALEVLSHDWASFNASLVVSQSEFITTDSYSIELYPQSASTIVLQLPDQQLKLVDNNRVLSFNAKIKAASSISVSTYLYLDDDYSSIVPNSQTITSGKFTAIHSNRIVVTDDTSLHSAYIKLEITNHNSNPVYITLPHLIHDMALFENPVLGQSRNFLPDFYFEIDAAQEYPTYPFFRFMDCLFQGAGETIVERDRLYGIESSQLLIPDENIEFWVGSTLVSPRSVRTAYIPWLSQFTGGSLRQNIQLSDGTYYFDNYALQRDFIEWQLYSCHYGRAAGTREAMSEAVKQVLIKTKNGEQSTKSVAVTPHYSGDPFAIKITTLVNETIDADNGESSYSVLQAVNPAKPMGYTVFHEAVNEFNFTLDDPSLGILDQMTYG